MKLNIKNPSKVGRTHEGAPAIRQSKIEELRRAVMSCLLWEQTFYEDGVDIAQRIADLVPQCPAEQVYVLAVEARHHMHLRHAPLWIIKAMTEASEDHKKLVGSALQACILRPDEITEFLAMYWKDGRHPLAAQVKKGLARAFQTFDGYQLAKYNRDGAVKLRDALFLSHAKPVNDEQQQLWQQLIDGTLSAPDTWEVALSTGQDKRETWERLLRERKLGGLALLRNLRNMQQANVTDLLIRESLSTMKTDRILPFRFIAAARHAPTFEEELEAALVRSLKEQPKLTGMTAVLVDVSASMTAALSSRSDMTRIDAACGVAMVCRELCGAVRVFSFSNATVEIPPRRGFALTDAIRSSQCNAGTWLGKAVDYVNGFPYDRLIVVTDEESHDVVGPPRGYGAKGYMINVGGYENAVGYGDWTRINGFSEAIIDYIRASESPEGRA